MTRLATSVQNSLADAASAGVSSSASCASSARSATAWAASTSALQAARSNFVFWDEATALPKTCRSWDGARALPDTLPLLGVPLSELHRGGGLGVGAVGDGEPLLREVLAQVG